MEELTPEDGWVTIDKKWYARIGWSRTIALADPTKESKFRELNLIHGKHVQFIIEHGKRKVRTYGGKSKDVFYELGMTRLDNLLNSDNPSIAKVASELDWIVRSNGPRLLLDEQELCELNGIHTTTAYPSIISYSAQTERVSVKWQTTTRGQQDVAMWGLLAPPNDVRKKKKLTRWAKSNPGLIGKAKRILRESNETIERIIGKEKEEGADAPV